VTAGRSLPCFFASFRNG